MPLPLDVAIVAFDNISPFHLAVPCLVFNDAFVSPNPADKPFNVTVCAEQNGSLTSSSPIGLNIASDLSCLESADIIIIPSWHDVAQAPSAKLIDALKQANLRGATIVGLCLGAFVLGYAGLLEDKAATTHWAYSDKFAELFPNALLDADPLFIESGNILTSAGTAAALDCCLHLVRHFLGNATATQISRLIVAPPYRSGGQKQFIPTPVPQTKGSQANIQRVLDEILGDLQQDYNVDSVAQACAMSRRSFTRHFKALTGDSFNHWLISQRLNYSQQLLEQGGLSIARVAELAGFNNESVYRKHFKAAYAIAPKQWQYAFAGQSST
ncbi:helix-turn-helix domain-containing protein [Shewanella sp. WXL01]|uniref:GlxA family transcriptional regulator n=1 Tax=Shewanella sp. WXL01 TaxID=2709721 RepID=UPI00143868AD|nr:helix-turn-helix domain-containing protein [Shewanella sp. WXL01]NKF49035.1 helix-turn-helix domain-containing protein [Shewanella sp. WXL01]